MSSISAERLRKLDILVPLQIQLVLPPVLEQILPLELLVPAVVLQILLLALHFNLF